MQNVARNVRPDEVEDDDVLADAIEDLRPRDLELEVAGNLRAYFRADVVDRLVRVGVGYAAAASSCRDWM